MEVYREQLNILLHAMKAVVQTKGCPDWVAYKLNAAVKEAKEYKPTGNEVGAAEKKFCELYPGMHVHSTTPGDTCVYEVVSEADPIQGVRLFNLRIISTRAKDPVGYTILNVPETMIDHCEV